MSALDRLNKKTRQAAETMLATDEHVITILAGRSKQAMIVTNRQIVIVKAGMLAGTAKGARATSFPFESIAAINVHTGPRFAALEVVVTGSQALDKPNLQTAYQLPNWLPCHPSVGSSPLIGELRAFVRSGGRAQSPRAALSDS